MSEEWRDLAACRATGPDLWFAETGSRTLAAQAKATCAGCPVAGPCLDYALANDIHHGIWGGMTERDRQYVRRDRPPIPRGRNVGFIRFDCLCRACGVTFTARSRTASTCSRACQVRWSRQRNGRKVAS